MRWIRYEAAAETRYGMLRGDDVVEVGGSPWADWGANGRTRRLADVRLLPPVVPPTFYAAGINYDAHIREAAALLGRTVDVPKAADIGYRAVNALVAHGAPILVPKDAGPRVHYEGELVAVIGRRARDLSEDEALGCVFGWTIGNDVSERDWQTVDRTLWRAKNTDTFKPMGPWIEIDVDLDRLTTIVRVNGRETSRFPTAGWLFSPATFIARMSRYVTLEPGDVIWMGTDGHSPDLVAGDVVEVEIDGLGVLRNPVAAA